MLKYIRRRSPAIRVTSKEAYQAQFYTPLPKKERIKVFNMRLTAAALLSAVAVSAHPNPGDKLTKPPVHPNLDYLEAGLEKYLPETSYTLHEWNNGYIPEG